jgi:hypothetical protein
MKEQPRPATTSLFPFFILSVLLPRDSAQIPPSQLQQLCVAAFTMAATFKPPGFIELQVPETPEIDVVFVHGLQGHPRRTWTYSKEKEKRPVLQDVPKKSSGGLKNLFKLPFRKLTTPSDPGPAAAASEPIEELEGSSRLRSEVFWPEDLLPALEECKQARILTYGYDSRYFDLIDKVNFSEITSQGETLLNGLARIRADCNRRPLMFIAHSLGGLLVKSVSQHRSLFSSSG